MLFITPKYKTGEYSFSWSKGLKSLAGSPPAFHLTLPSLWGIRTPRFLTTYLRTFNIIHCVILQASAYLKGLFCVSNEVSLIIVEYHQK